MEFLCNKLEEICSRIDKAFVNFKKSPKERITRPYVKVRLENLDKLWKQLTNNHSKLFEQLDPLELKTCSYVKQDSYDQPED